jgi:aspartate racemase
LERAGVTVLGIGANTMHMNFDEVQDAVSIPVIDVRSAVATEVLAMEQYSVALLGTKYLLDASFYSETLQKLGVTSVRHPPLRLRSFKRLSSMNSQRTS